MGMFDEIRCELAMPEDREALKNSFQTKSLWCSMDLFTITASGRLIYHKRRYSLASDGTPRLAEHVADIDMDYHGDIEIHGAGTDGTSLCYAVRFTHGTVEWIRNFEELPEIQRTWLMERGR